jgi:hypothetical protein
MGRAGGLKGDKIRMAALSQGQRSRLARRAARARWRRPRGPNEYGPNTGEPGPTVKVDMAGQGLHEIAEKLSV